MGMGRDDDAASEDTAVVQLPPIDGTGHRLPQDWALESSHEMNTANHTAVQSEASRLMSRREIKYGVQTTMTCEAKTMRALRSKMQQTKNLKSILENTLDKTDYEIGKMQECKERLQTEKERVSNNLEVNLDRRKHRSQRPSRELVHDGPHRQLDNQTTLLQDIISKVEKMIEEVDESLEQLQKMKWMLAADLADKNTSLELDSKCADMGSTWPEGDQPNANLPNNKLMHVPTSWKIQTMQTVELALQQHQEANELRQRAAKMAHNAKLAEKVQYDTVQAALEKKIANITKMKRDLELKLQHVTQEIADATRTKHKLEESIALKTPPLRITLQRYETRIQRPDRELVHDEVEHALKDQYESLHTSVMQLQEQLNKVNKHLDDLESSKAQLDADIADKNENLDMDKQCHSMAPPRPKTRGVLLGWHPVQEYHPHREITVTWDTAPATKLMSY
mmetsp:Transcript_17183/g.20673  ORF Transcript_17183/g.20673 Transcript_17183/m.20673 type:complete len:451 (-) Transcript_17183:248-1600(-)|eukprot:CAMPEP_0197843376 /NCGR_PEP_ID=MMETSP1438-20131217/220_1 /TAXON_ID=1461541 /ORGANISM="Pterosperma sp., Strain CCMP1384" /LENGTH=450 /DNA_ID=CAMNT_0043453479 /DNA_START=372 /DNA_END=1724 /DNA_ORIENTATION=+